METTNRFGKTAETWLGNLLLMLQVLLVLLWIFSDRISIPASFTWTGRMHPLLVHFPISLLLMLALAWFLRKATGESLFSTHGFRLVLLFTAILATLTAITGYLLASGGSYDDTLLARHRNLGTLTAICAYLMWMACPSTPADSGEETSIPGIGKNFRIPQGLFSILVIGTAAFMIAASHFGGSLTHGEEYLFPEEEQPVAQPGIITDSTPVFDASIRPILESKCYSCHNEKKTKGDFVMTTMEGLLRGGKNGAPWIAGDPVNSLLMQRMLLDIGDKKHMPPKGKPQPGERDIELIRYWIHRGADRKIALRALPDRDSLRILAEQSLQGQMFGSMPKKTYPFKAADPSALEKLRSPNYSLLPVYQGAPALELSFFIRQGFQPSMIRAFEPVREQIVSLNLAYMPVGDSILPEIGKFSNLEALNLSGTAVSGAGLASLASLKKLGALSLSGTRVTVAGLQALSAIPSLKKVFLWQTPIDDASLATLQKAMPGIHWETGSRTNASEKLRLTPPQLADPDKFIFQDTEHLLLEHPMKGARIRYTTDGSVPDSTSAPLYEKGLTVDRPMTVKAIAVMDGWYASDVRTFSVFAAGRKPLSTTLLTQPDPKYSLQGAESLFDLQKGDPGNLLVHWLGYREGNMKLHVIMDGTQDISQVIVSAGINHGSYVFPPFDVEVRAGMDSGRWETTARIRPEQPRTYGPLQNLACTVPIRKARWKHLEITVKPVPVLPSWHSGKGQKAWVFVDEIFIY